MQMVGQPARDLARHFVQRSVFHKRAYNPRTDEIHPTKLELPLAHKGMYSAHSSQGISEMVCRITHARCPLYYLHQSSGPESLLQWVSQALVSSRYVGQLALGPWGRQTRLSIPFRMRTSKVSGLHMPTLSLMSDSCLAIQMSEHFVYIENQFFISS